MKRVSDAIMNACRVTDQNTHKLQHKVAAAEDQRRALHEQIMELKGNIRVFCRVRPPLSMHNDSCDDTDDCTENEPAVEDPPVLLFPGDGVTLELIPPLAPGATDHGAELKPKKQEFAFDKVQQDHCTLVY